MFVYQSHYSQVIEIPTMKTGLTTHLKCITTKIKASRRQCDIQIRAYQARSFQDTLRQPRMTVAKDPLDAYLDSK